MSDTPRTDAQAAYCESQCIKLEWLGACDAVLHMAYWCEIMEARARRNGRIAWRMRRELAAVTQERDAASIRAGCASVGVDALKQERDTLNWDRAQLTNRAVHAEQQLAEARRQVDAMCKHLVKVDSVPPCVDCTHDNDCMACWRAWAAQQAKEATCTTQQ